VGCGIFSEELNLKVSFALGTFATVFQAEVYAIMACSDYCLRECPICIYSDSRAALLALSSYTVSSRLVLQCRNSLQGLSIHNEVQLFWVPGHCGIIMNKEAGGLVGVGPKSSFCRGFSDNHLSYWNLVS
jgi:ribonuclease HI